MKTIGPEAELPNPAKMEDQPPATLFEAPLPMNEKLAPDCMTFLLSLAMADLVPFWLF